MRWQYNPYAIPLLVAAAVSTLTVLYAWKRRVAPGARAFMVLMAACTLWSFGAALEQSSAELLGKILWVDLNWLGIATVPAAWLCVALQFTGEGKHVTSRNLALLAVVPTGALLLVWTNPFHHLFYAEIRLAARNGVFEGIWVRGPIFWANAVYSYVLVLAGTVLVLRAIVLSPRVYRLQAGSLIVACLVPWASNALYLAGWKPLGGTDITPFAFTLTGVLMGWSLLHFGFLALLPLARAAVIEGMGDGVVVLDPLLRVVDLNPAAGRILERKASDPSLSLRRCFRGRDARETQETAGF